MSSQDSWQADQWQTIDRILSFQTKWLSLIGEHLQDHTGKVLEYWRVEKADSVIILPIQQQHLILPMPMYRPGVGQSTLDFPGGRCPEGQSPEQVVAPILHRELAVPAGAIAQLTPLNQTGWPINSSFSNQKLYGFVAELQPDFEIPPALVAGTYPHDSEGFQALFETILCLQCRLVLREWQARFI